MINKDVWAIVQISIDPRFEIRYFLKELWNEWMILGKHECFHQIRHDIIILFFQFLQQISKTSINIFMYVPNYKKPHLNFFENFILIIPVNVTSNYPSPNTILFLILTILDWSILSWITRKESSLDLTYSTLWVWYKHRQDSWWMLCFFNLISCSFT